MKQNTKFLWIYTAILFSFALILILFAGLTQNNFQKELDEQATLSKGMEQSVSELTARNQQLSDEVKRLTGELEATKAQLEETSRLRTEVEDRFRIHEELDARLSKALWQRNDGNRSAARKTLDGVDRSTLTESQKYFMTEHFGKEPRPQKPKINKEVSAKRIFAPQKSKNLTKTYQT